MSCTPFIPRIIIFRYRIGKRAMRQLTDVYLLALALSHHARLATFDSTTSLRAIESAREENLAVITA